MHYAQLQKTKRLYNALFHVISNIKLMSKVTKDKGFQNIEKNALCKLLLTLL